MFGLSCWLKVRGGYCSLFIVVLQQCCLCIYIYVYIYIFVYLFQFCLTFEWYKHMLCSKWKVLRNHIFIFMHTTGKLLFTVLCHLKWTVSFRLSVINLLYAAWTLKHLGSAPHYFWYQNPGERNAINCLWTILSAVLFKKIIINIS